MMDEEAFFFFDAVEIETGEVDHPIAWISTCQVEEDQWLNDYLCSDHYTNSLLSLYPDYTTASCSSQPVELGTSLEDKEVTDEPNGFEMSWPLPPHDHDNSEFCSSNSVISAFEVSQVEQADPFLEKLAERLNFFNVLNQERLIGLKAIQNDGILRSVEYDLELINVARTSLFWEALHHQYWKVEAITLSSQNSVFHHRVLAKFQEFQILLERFVEEEEESRGRREYPNNMHKGLYFGSRLSIPNVTGFMIQENADCLEIETIGVDKVLKVMKRFVQAFWLYVKADTKKPFKGANPKAHHPTVEDPVDLELLYSVTKALHKKETILRDLQGKTRFWLRRRVEPPRTESEKMNLLFAMIDVKLVKRVLRMPLVSGSQLKWCWEKLSSLEFGQRQVIRHPTSFLFPSS